MRVILRLRVEDKLYTSKYRNETQQLIVKSVIAAVNRFNIVDDYFEIVVTTKDAYITKCYLKMSEEIYEYFIDSYGGKKYLERDYQIIFLKTA